MESKEVKRLMEAYASIYEKKEEKEIKKDEDEKSESEKDEGGKHKEGKHKKGKEEKGEKVTEKEDEEKEDEKEMKENADLFDYILEHLVAEGYADTNESAIAIMANMSEEWKQSIVEESRGAELRAKHGANPSKKLDAKAFRKALSYDNRDRLSTGTGTEMRARYLALSGRAGSRARGETPASSAVSPDNESRTVRSRGGKPKGIGAGENRDRPTG